ncbi:MAG: hypothetical protein WAO91_10670 [Candidatus Nitrosotenuis sp.]
MDKNQDADQIHQMIFSKNLASISFDDAITKTYFFHKLGLLEETPTIYLDFDLLYSGYVAANILQQNENIAIHNLNENTWKELLVTVLEQISKDQHLVIIDSLNGFFVTLSDQKDSGRIINSVLVLLASVGQKTNSVVLAGSVSKYKKDEGWVLPTIGRHILQIEKMNNFSVRKQNSHFQLALVDKDNSPKSTLQITDFDLV